MAHASHAGPATDGYSSSYKAYILFLLTALYTSNYADRQILSVLNEAIKAEFQLSDSAMGVLGGIAFALIYTTAGIPVAMLADRKSRKVIMGAAATIWSVFTALCGFAGNYWHLLLARVGVGIGEAGGSPPAHSMISDLYEPKQRATALAIYSTGVPIGVAVGLFLGAPIAAAYGWRSAFFILGIPGLVLALLLMLTVREPRRGMSEQRAEDEAGQGQAPSFGAVLKFMLSQPSLRHVIAGATIVTTVGYAGVHWNLPFLMRSHGMDLVSAAHYLGLVAMLGSVTGTALGGILADALGRWDVRWNAWIIALMFSIGLPFGIYALWSEDTALVLWLLPIPTFVAGVYLGPTFAMTQNLVGLRMRSVASALLLFIINLIGMGLGPLLAGVLSDFLTADYGHHALKQALFLMSFLSIWGVVHYILAGRTLEADYARAARA